MNSKAFTARENYVFPYVNPFLLELKRKINFKSSSKGFTLFTALVSFILIVLAVLITQSMTRLESNTITIMSDLEEQSELQSIAEMARADALQTFNYDIRYALEYYFKNEANVYELKDDETDIEKIKQGFIEQFFVSDRVSAFSIKLASALENTLATIQDPRGYIISLDSGDRFRTQQKFNELMLKSGEEDEFMEIIECNRFDNCDGSFYINLNFALLEDEEYEALPALVITSTKTERTIRQPIIPRGNLRIYVPIRIFKALEAGRTMKDKMDSVSRLIENYKLGFCQGCAPITDPKTRTCAGNCNIWNTNCPKEPANTINLTPNGTYEDTQESIRTNLMNIVESKLQEESNNLRYTHINSENEEFVTSIERVNVIINDSQKRVNQDEEGRDMFCGFVDSFEVIIGFKELNQDYKILKEEDPIYRVRIKQNLNQNYSISPHGCKTERDNCVRA